MPELGLGAALAVPKFLQASDLGVLALPLLHQARDALVQQAELEQREVAAQRLAAGAQFLAALAELGMAVEIGHQWREQLDLALGLEHRLVGPVQVVEVPDQRRDARSHLERLQHVAAHEVGQVAHGLERHGLMEQLQRLLVLDAEAAPEPGAVGWEAVEHFHVAAGAARAQPLAQGRDVGAEVGEIAGYRQGPLGADKEARRLRLCVLHPEHLCQRHGLVVARVVKNAQDHRKVVVVAQRHGFGAARHLVALRLVVPQHVGAQRALLGIRACGLVVGDALRRHQQRGDCIDQRGLARADVAGQQHVLAHGIERPDAGVEGAPVEQLQALQAKTRQGVVGDEIQAQGLRFYVGLIHRWPLPQSFRFASGRPAAARQNRPARAAAVAACTARPA